MKIIKEFRGKYSFLSNFYSAKVAYRGITYDNNESAFQAQKCPNEVQKKQFCGITPNIAKRKGRDVHCNIAEWNSKRDSVMFDIVFLKFLQNKHLLERLLDTGDAILIEGNTWGDRYWGVVGNTSRNKLGEILMEVRWKLRYDKAPEDCKG